MLIKVWVAACVRAFIYLIPNLKVEIQEALLRLVNQFYSCDISNSALLCTFLKFIESVAQEITFI